MENMNTPQLLADASSELQEIQTVRKDLQAKYNQPIVEPDAADSLLTTLNRWEARQKKKMDSLETNEEKLTLLQRDNALLSEMIADLTAMAAKYEIDVTV